jgi:hypothetical protein
VNVVVGPTTRRESSSVPERTRTGPTVGTAFKSSNAATVANGGKRDPMSNDDEQTTLGVANGRNDEDNETADGACVHCGNVVPGHGRICADCLDAVRAAERE